MARARLAFIYSAQGTQWAGMGRDLLDDATFRRAIELCDRSIRRHFSWSLYDEMTAEPASWRLHAEWQFAQPAVTALQIALTEMLAQRGIRPDGVGALSMGEAAAMHAAGALDLDETMDVVCSVVRFAETKPPPGVMAMLFTSADDCRRLLGDNSKVSIAVELGAQRTVISGEEVALRDVMAQAERAGVGSTPLRLLHGYHSPCMADLGEGFVRRLEGLRGHEARIDAYSGVTGAVRSHADATHWWDVCRRPARFRQLALNMLRDGYRRFVEIGPHAMLSAAIEEAAVSLGITPDVQPIMLRGAPAVDRLNALAGRIAKDSSGT